jgi:hypothetical protein
MKPRRSTRVRRSADVALERAPLAASGLERGHWHPQRHAGAAAVAVGSVGEHAAATEAVGDQAGIGVGMDQVAGRGHLRPRQAVGQVAAGIRRRRIELQRRQRKFLRIRHAGLAGGSGWGVAVRRAQLRPHSAMIGPGSRAAAASPAFEVGLELRRGISRAPKLARWRVCCWQSMRSMPSARQNATSVHRAILDASVRWENIDSPKNMRPMPTPYRPPVSWPSIQVSTLCTRPRWCQAHVGLDQLGHDPGAAWPVRGLLAQAGHHLLEGAVDAQLAAGRPREAAQRLAQRCGQAELGHRQHHAWIRVPTTAPAGLG